MENYEFRIKIHRQAPPFSQSPGATFFAIPAAYSPIPATSITNFVSSPQMLRTISRRGFLVLSSVAMVPSQSVLVFLPLRMTHPVLSILISTELCQGALISDSSQSRESHSMVSNPSPLMSMRVKVGSFLPFCRFSSMWSR